MGTLACSAPGRWRGIDFEHTRDNRNRSWSDLETFVTLGTGEEGWLLARLSICLGDQLQAWPNPHFLRL